LLRSIPSYGWTVPPSGGQVLGANLNCSESCLGRGTTPTEDGVLRVYDADYDPVAHSIGLAEPTADGKLFLFTLACAGSAVFLLPFLVAQHSISSPILRGSTSWVRARRASLALLPQRPRQNESSTGASEPAKASPPIFSVLSPGFDSSHPLQLVQPFSKIRRLQCLDIGFYQLAKLASLGRGEIADRNGLQESATRRNSRSSCRATFTLLNDSSAPSPPAFPAFFHSAHSAFSFRANTERGTADHHTDTRGRRPFLNNPAPLRSRLLNDVVVGKAWRDNKSCQRGTGQCRDRDGAAALGNIGWAPPNSLGVFLIYF
jgi:hypothetical protein